MVPCSFRVAVRARAHVVCPCSCCSVHVRVAASMFVLQCVCAHVCARATACARTRAKACRGAVLVPFGLLQDVAVDDDAGIPIGKVVVELLVQGARMRRQRRLLPHPQRVLALQREELDGNLLEHPYARVGGVRVEGQDVGFFTREGFASHQAKGVRLAASWFG